MYKFGTYENILSELNDSAPLAIDTETVGKYGKIRLVQFYQSHWDKVIMLDRPDPIELFVFLQTKLNKVNLVFQFSSYDVSTIQEQTGGRYVPETFNDVFYLARLAYPAAESFSLDNIMLTVLGFDPYKKHNLDKTKMQKSKWDSLILTDDQKMYAAIDVYYLLDVYEKVKSFEADMNYKLDMHALRKALDFQCNGLPVLQNEISKQYESNVDKIEEYDMPINVNSYVQVRPYVNLDSSNELALATSALQGNDRARDVLAVRKIIKQNSFLDKFAPAARSGRFTCKDQNLQQLPRKLKHCFGVEPGSGKVLLYADYPQLELRSIAAIVEEQNLMQLFKTGGDPHNFIAESLFGKGWTEDQRQLVKTYNFNLLYCGGAGMIQSILIKQDGTLRDLDLIRKEIRIWKRAWPNIANWQQECIRSHRRHSLKQTPMGRRYLGKLLTDHANIENQGFGSEIAKLALHYMYDDLKANDAKLCNFIHDSYIIEMDEDEEANMRVATIVKEAMEEAWYEGCKMVPAKNIPMPVKVFCGYNWGKIEKDDYLFEVS